MIRRLFRELQFTVADAAPSVTFVLHVIILHAMQYLAG